MASGWRAGGDSEVLLLLEEYCSHRRPTATRPRPGVIRPQGPGPGVMRPQGGSFSSCSSSSSSSSRSFLSTTVPAIVKFRTVKVKRPSTPELESDSVGGKYDDSDSESQSRSSAVERLVQITEAAPVPQVYVESQDEIVQKLVNLMITLGDDINQKIAQTPLLQQQLSNMNYELFEKVTSTVQSLVDPGRAAGSRPGTGFESEAEVQQQKIAWAFEVTSRLSVVGVVQRRRVLSFGDKYIQQHHSAWVQEHGGWDEVFAVD